MKRLFGVFFIAAGVLHFVRPSMYEAIMPDYLPAQRELVYISGVAEIAGGAMVLAPRTRRWGSWLSIATLLAVFPANVHMALTPDRYDISPILLWLRLPVQGLLLWWAWAAGRD